MGDTFTKVKSQALIFSSALLVNINYLGRHGCEKNPQNIRQNKELRAWRRKNHDGI